MKPNKYDTLRTMCRDLSTVLIVMEVSALMKKFLNITFTNIFKNTTDKVNGQM